MPKAGAWAAVVIVISTVVSLTAPVVLYFPDQLRLLPGQEYVVRTGPLFTVAEVASANAAIVSLSGGSPTLRGTALGDHSVQLRVLGLLPIRSARVQIVPEVRVVPGGQAVGVLLSSAGLLVVRTVAVEGADGKQYFPAKDAGIRPGDVILRVGSSDLIHPRQMEDETATWGQRGLPMPVTVRRDGRILHLEMKPVLGREPFGRGGTRYLVGLYLKDPAAGVGTLTFWDPVTRRYGALGHMITDGDREAVVVTDGRIVPAYIHSIEPGVRGRPGEKLGLFDDKAGALGTIDTNTPFGIFGTLMRLPEKERYLPVALAQDVVPGPAEMLTVLEGERVEGFHVEILEVSRQYRPGGKGLVIKVTDPRLIKRTNGIVQGMSGSPLVQNGKLIGAVTHVYVNDPIRGFGILAEWMVYESGIMRNKNAAQLREGEKPAA